MESGEPQDCIERAVQSPTTPAHLPSGDASPTHARSYEGGKRRPRRGPSGRGRRAALTARPAKRPQASGARAAPGRARGQPGPLPGPARPERPARTYLLPPPPLRRGRAGPPSRRPPALKAAAPERPQRRPRRRGLRCRSGRLSVPSCSACPAPSAEPARCRGLAPLLARSKGFSERRASTRSSPVFKNADKNPRGKGAITHIPAERQGKRGGFFPFAHQLKGAVSPVWPRESSPACRGQHSYGRQRPGPALPLGQRDLGPLLGSSAPPSVPFVFLLLERSLRFSPHTLPGVGSREGPSRAVGVPQEGTARWQVE
ncbi:serine/arginine repetitive matrix protein 1-like [Passer domesticus]|uniref:serine/arginine repetitive matrix protein 1-like n=1 Tax=Passer domesticus TaxID=48849 RepID=UPI0030FE17A5